MYRHENVRRMPCSLRAPRHPLTLPEKDSSSWQINYDPAVSGHHRLISSDTAQEVLTDDQDSMVTIGMLLDEGESLNKSMEQDAMIKARANALRSTDRYDMNN